MFHCFLVAFLVVVKAVLYFRGCVLSRKRRIYINIDIEGEKEGGREGGNLN